jgi:hypothetical protein
MGLALAIKEALRSGARALPPSQQQGSCGALTRRDPRGQAGKTSASDDLQPPPQPEAKAGLTQQCHEASNLATQRVAGDDFAAIEAGQRTWKRDDTITGPPALTAWQQVIHARLPLVRIEPRLREVEHRTDFRRHGTPVQGHQARPPPVDTTRMAALLAQAPQLGVVSLSARGQGLSVDMLRQVVPDCGRAATLTAARAELVNRHHARPVSAGPGTGPLASSDAPRCGMRASRLLASYSPRDDGYDDKALGL